MDEMRTSRPDRPFSLHRFTGRIQALHAGHLIADSDAAVLVKDGDQETFYFPAKDVEMEQMARTDYVVERPHYGRAHHWTLTRNGQMYENGVWSFLETEPGAEDLQGMVAFRPDIVEIHFVEPQHDEAWRREQERIGDYIRHTDSGSGRSQDDHWPPNVTPPAD